MYNTKFLAKLVKEGFNVHGTWEGIAEYVTEKLQLCEEIQSKINESQSEIETVQLHLEALNKNIEKLQDECPHPQFKSKLDTIRRDYIPYCAICGKEDV